MTPESTQDWYSQLLKPSFAPPAWIFGPVWSVLYVIIILSFGYVFLQVATKRWSVRIAIPFALNILANLSFTPLQFGLKNNVLAFIDIIIVFATILWAMKAIKPFSKLIMWVQMPYLLWVSFATVLQATITWMNI